jgi:hypothetical protein
MRGKRGGGGGVCLLLDAVRKTFDNAATTGIMQRRALRAQDDNIFEPDSVDRLQEATETT